MRLPILAGAALAAVLVAGCAKQSPVATVSATEAALAASGKVAVAYMQQPPCTGSNGPLCSDAELKAKIKLAFNAAYDSAAEAQAVADAGGTPNMTALNAAMAALQNLLANLPK